MTALQFDEMELNTDLAKEYFKMYNNKFSNKSLNDNPFEKDGYGNTIFYDDVTDLNNRHESEAWKDVKERENTLRKLAKLIEKNAELFSQIEYLVRKIPVDEVREYDIKLIVKNLLCSDRHMYNYDVPLFEMRDNAPLAHLGYVANMLLHRKGIIIVAYKNTAIVTYLFAELCQSVGLDLVRTHCLDNNDWRTLFPSHVITNISAAFADEGCTGVVTERCDIDSAIDTFVHTTTNYPWRLRRVYVEECAYARFSSALAARAPAPAPAPRAPAPALTAGGKTFLLSHAGQPPAPNGILVEAYRTTKELLSLLTERPPFYLSLWASDVAQANEIALRAPCSIVWINGFGVFDGPPQIARAIYTNDDYDAERLFKDLPESVVRKRELWANTSFEERLAFLQNATDEFYDKVSNDNSVLSDRNFEKIENLRCELYKIKNENFVTVENSRMCVGLCTPTEFVFINMKRLTFDVLARALASGSTIGLELESTGTMLTKYFDLLATKIPIKKFEQLNFEETLPCDFTRTKVIWTNFGTIFAN